MLKPSSLTKGGRRATLARTFAVLALLTVCAPRGAAQTAVAAPDRRVTIRRLFEAAGTRQVMTALFEEMVGRYQKNWPDAVIAGYRQKNLFAGLTPGETAQMESLVREFSDRVFSDTKARVKGQLITDDMLVALSEPVFVKYLDDVELAQLAEFVRTPTGRKSVEVAYKHLSDSLLSVMESKGMFRVSPNPDEDVARLNQLMQDARGGGFSAEVHQKLAGLVFLVPAEFTQDEWRELVAFWQTPLGVKLAKVSPALAAEIFQRNAAVCAPRAGELTQQVMNEQMEFFKERTAEILKHAGPRMKRAASRRRRN